MLTPTSFNLHLTTNFMLTNWKKMSAFFHSTPLFQMHPSQGCLLSICPHKGTVPQIEVPHFGNFSIRIRMSRVKIHGHWFNWTPPGSCLANCNWSTVVCVDFHSIFENNHPIPNHQIVWLYQAVWNFASGTNVIMQFTSWLFWICHWICVWSHLINYGIRNIAATT